MTIADVKALTFDVFGTVVDYRSTIIAEGEQLNRDKIGQLLPMPGAVATVPLWIV